MNTHRTNCYFYNQDYDMGAIISTCGADPDNFVWGKCECFQCKNFLSKADANKIVRKYLKKLKQSNFYSNEYMETNND